MVSLCMSTRLVFELKKDATAPQHARQAIGQLISAAYHSVYPVVHILTDLRTYFQFAWFERDANGQTVLVACFEDSPAIGWLLVNNFLSHADGAPLVPWDRLFVKGGYDPIKPPPRHTPRAIGVAGATVPVALPRGEPRLQAMLRT
eukprot:Opistho-1_new@88369